MKKKVISILSICALAVTGLAFSALQPMNVSAEEMSVYVSSNGSDTGLGTDASPYATLDKALTVVANGGTITLKDTVAVDSWTAHGKTVTITGGTLNVSGMTEFEINDSVTFTNIHWQADAGTYVYGNGYKTTMGAGVSWSNEVRLFGGGKEGTTVESTDLTVLSGTYSYIYGGGYKGSMIKGDTNLVVGGSTNNSSAVDNAINDHTENYFIFGGGHSTNTIKGNTNLVVQDQAKAVYVFGASHGYSGDLRYISGSANTTILSGMMMSVYGGSKGGYASNGANVRIEGGEMQQVFGGSESWPFSMGDIKLQIVGGTITRRVYGGCYNDDTKYYVQRGKITLEIGGDANITFGASHLDKGIYARSRYEGDVEDCQIVFTSQSAYDAYKDKLGGYDWGASYVMGSTSAADAYHYYTYTQEDNQITQGCAYHEDLAATAIINRKENISLQYTGSAIEPFTLTVSQDWEYTQPTIAYENNVERGKATCTITAGQVVCGEENFIIVDTPVVLGASVRTAAPSGLRFQSKIPTKLMDSGATFGTLVIPKAVLDEGALTADTPKVMDIEQTKWATEVVKFNNPSQYEEGYEYFNAVLTGIPEDCYDQVIVARSYVYANGQYYYSAPIERSIAQVSAYALQDGYTNEILYDYVDKALADSTVSMQETVTVYEGETYQLTLSGNKGYVAIWSTDSDLIFLDNNGKVTAGKTEGEAVVTAKLGNITVKCTIIVKQRWTGYY